MWMYLIPILVGISIVLQGTFNREIAGHWGLASAVFFNGIVFFVACLAFYLLAKFAPQTVSEIFRLKTVAVQIKPWWVLPGLFGFVIVLGVPYAIQYLGALKVFVLLIATQIIFSMGWDYFIDSQPITALRAVGSLTVLIGAVLVSFSS